MRNCLNCKYVLCELHENNTSNTCGKYECDNGENNISFRTDPNKKTLKEKLLIYFVITLLLIYFVITLLVVFLLCILFVPDALGKLLDKWV